MTSLRPGRVRRVRTPLIVHSCDVLSLLRLSVGWTFPRGLVLVSCIERHPAPVGGPDRVRYVFAFIINPNELSLAVLATTDAGHMFVKIVPERQPPER
jgi:hypothetical protein